jgi:hypothetical protein
VSFLNFWLDSVTSFFEFLVEFVGALVGMLCLKSKPFVDSDHIITDHNVIMVFVS